MSETTFVTKTDKSKTQKIHLSLSFLLFFRFIKKGIFTFLNIPLLCRVTPFHLTEIITLNGLSVK